MFAEKNAHVVRVDLSVRILVDHAEDRQNRVVKATDQLLLEELNPL